MKSTSIYNRRATARVVLTGILAAASTAACLTPLDAPIAEGSGPGVASAASANGEPGLAVGGAPQDALYGEPCDEGAAGASCDARRGLRCEAASDGGAGPGRCICAPGQAWSDEAGSCAGHRLGERPGDACGPGGEGLVEFSPCNPRRGLFCAPPPRELVDAPPTCACPEGQAWAGARGRCVAEPAPGGCGGSK